MKQETLKALHAEWRKIPSEIRAPAGLAEREARMAWTNERLGKRGQVTGNSKGSGSVTCHLLPITSWSELTEGQARRLIKLMREESGSGPNYRALLIAKLACEFWGVQWYECLRDDLQRRFRTPNPQSLTPSQAHAEIEELVSRIARRDGCEIEMVRAKFSPQRRRGAEKIQPQITQNTQIEEPEGNPFSESASSASSAASIEPDATSRRARHLQDYAREAAG